MNKNENYSMNDNKKITKHFRNPNKLKFSYIYQNINNIPNFRLMSYKDISNPKNMRNIKYLNYKQRLLKKCNSQIMENKQIFPILKINPNHLPNNLISRSNGNLDKKYPLIQNKSISNSKIVKISQIKPIKIPNISSSFSPNINIKKNLSDKGIKDENENEENLKESHKESSEKKNEENIEKSGEENEEKEIILNDNENMEKLSKDLFSEKSEKNKKNEYKFRPYKFSKFYKLSKSRNVSAKNVYQHYLSLETKDIVSDPIDNFTKFIEKKYRNQKKIFDKLYLIDKPFLDRMEEIKSNRKLAYKDDFNIEEYQNILCKMLNKRVGSNLIFYLQQDYKKFNEKNGKGFHRYKGRYTKLSERIRNNAPSYLIDKLRKLDLDKLKAKAKYFKIKNKQNDLDVEYAINDFDYYLENKFVPNIKI